ncbi:MAG TPA: hypothetical protein VFR86_00435 [Burkholderiaceae bacterium]|nr:hypothetical protein [Burkholderiaceae bacterium]
MGIRAHSVRHRRPAMSAIRDWGARMGESDTSIQGAGQDARADDPMQYKITPPVTSPYAIERTQILERIRQSVGTKVVLVRAPAGYGKTATLVQLHRQLSAQAVDCAWVQLDEADNDVSRFVTSVRRALAIDAGPARSQPDLARREPDPAEALMEAIARRRSPFALFIDDMDAVSSPAVLALFATVIARLPPRAMLVVGSRNEPDIGLARLRANGQLLEIGAHLLQLSVVETTEFLVARRGLRLPSEQIAKLHRQTEGWITALWLASIVRLRAASEGNRGAGTSGAKSFGFPFPGTLLAEALYEAGDIDAAEPLLRGVVPLLLDIALPDQLITAHVLLARIQRQRGERDGALLDPLVDVEALETVGHRLRLPRAVACARLERAWGLVDRGDFAEAERQIERSGSAAFWAGLDGRCHVANDVSTPAIARARLLIRRGSPGQAIPELKRRSSGRKVQSACGAR